MPTTRHYLFLVPLFLTALCATTCKEDLPPFKPGTASSGQGGSGGSSGAIISESAASSFETDPQIAVLAGQLVVAVWTSGTSDGEATKIGYSFSSDGGDTWQPPTTIENPDGQYAARPDVAVDVKGGFYLVWLSYGREGKGGQILSAKATESHPTFGKPAPVTDDTIVGFYERPRVTVTKTGRILTAYTKAKEGVNALVVADSYDGVTWDRFEFDKPDRHVSVPYACAQPQSGVALGRIWVTYQQDGRANLIVSEDEGMTWTPGGKVNEDAEDGQVAQAQFCGGAEDDLWVSYGIADPKGKGLLARVRIAHSTDGGKSFSEHIDAHDPDAAPNYANPAMAFENEMPPTLDVAYYAGAGIGDTIAGLLRARLPLTGLGMDGGVDPGGTGGNGGGSPDAGIVGTPSEVVYKPITLNLTATSPKWLGDYIGTATSTGKLFVAFVDNSQEAAHIAFKRVDSP